MATGMVLSVAQTLFSALQCKELRELCCMFGYQSQLEALRGTVETIKNVLLDAESKQQELNSQGLDWLNKLKDAVYDADDLFDEFATIAQRQKMMPHGKISKTVRAFFSSENQFLFAVSTSQKIKKIREKLDSVAKDRADFGFSNVYRAVKRKEETWSYVHEHSIIGRDIDKEAIIDMLLRESIDSVSFVSIVGMGGLGKTALAQLVYNDGRIKSAFELKLWVCVSDDFSIEEILHKMLKSATEQDPCDLGIDGLQRKVRRRIEGTKYLLILDDVWNESRDEWLKLREFLQVGARGSRIVVTTRSEKVGGAIGDDPMYALRGLQDDDSWLLFKRISLNHESKVVDDDLVCSGKEIVKKCANVPLAIRVVGSMLYGCNKSKWKLFQSIELPEMDRGEESIMPILKFSYHHLPPQLKSCFSYCALFPKDYAIVKNMLICLWSALGYLKPLNDMQSIEDVGEEYFSILLNRCFFQDIERDSYGEIYSCGMHDLIHDLAQEVAGKELCLTETSKSILEGKRHLSLSIWRPSLLCTSDTVGKLRGLRTFLRPSIRQLNCESPMTTVIAKCKRLRVLDLHHFSIKVLPSTIKNLLHLRYLDLSYNMELKILPESISRLYNLQALNLRSCLQLKELPKDVRELVNLRHLDTFNCFSLTHMPVGMDSMTSLCTLTRFVLGPKSSKKTQMGQLRDLMPLINLRNRLEIELKRGYAYDLNNSEEGSYLLNKEHIKVLLIEQENIWVRSHRINHLYQQDDPVVLKERLLERLEPHHDLREIRITGYEGVTLPRWAAKLAMSLPRLVTISLVYFRDLQHLPAMSQLQHLKYLTLIEMPNVEFVEDDSGGAAVVPSFPSLESLFLWNCQSLKCFPDCPHVKKFTLCGLDEALTFCRHRDDATATSAGSSLSSSNNNNSDVFDLWELKTDNLGILKSLFRDSIQSIHHLTLLNMEVQSLSSSVQEYNQKYAFSIHSLKFLSCPNLKSLSGGGIEGLTNLKTLSIWECHNLKLEEEEGFPWKALHVLSDLSFNELPQLVHLPKGLQYLTTLQSLEIEFCDKLEALPEWLDCLKSLRSLDIRYCLRLKSLPETIFPSLTTLHIHFCDGLKEKYSEPNGTDFSKICFIPDLHLYF